MPGCKFEEEIHENVVVSPWKQMFKNGNGLASSVKLQQTPLHQQPPAFAVYHTTRLPPKAISIKAFAATRQTELPSGRSVKPKRIVDEGGGKSEELEAAGPTVRDGGVDEVRQLSLEVMERKLDIGSPVTKDLEGISPSEVTTQLDSSDRGVVQLESPEIIPIIDASSSGNLVQSTILQGALEDGPPANASQLLSLVADTAHPQQAFASGISENWAEIRTLSNKIHQDFGIGLIIVAQRDLQHGDDDIMLHATEGLDRRKFLEHLEASFLNFNSVAANDVGAAQREQTSEEAEVLGKTKTKTDVDAQILNELKDLLTESAREAGLNLLDKNGRLMWATVGDIMAEKHAYLDNYPYILMPHENRQQKWKGIQNLRKSERKELIKALRSKVNRCQFIKLPRAQRGDIDSSKHPLILCAPPSADSPHKQGLRYFRNGLRDRRGHPRISTSSPVRNVADDV